MAALRLILRFRELTPGVDTITAHDEIRSATGHVWWGWWKKEREPDRGCELAELKNVVRAGKLFDAWLIDTSAERMHRATISDIQIGELPLEERAHVPEYYRNNSNIAAWFKMLGIEKNVEYRPE